MVENEIIMRRVISLAIFLALFSLCAGAQEFSWKRVLMDESRTGTKMATAGNVKSSLGSVEGCKYVAPNGKTFRGATKKAAKVVLAAQDKMAEVKTVIGHCPGGMKSYAPESELSNWVADEYIRAVQEITGKRVDVSFANFGGIRAPMPDGDVLVDDIMSMFPFKNKFCYVELRGSDLRAIYNQLAGNMQVIGGAKLTVKDGKLVDVLVGGEPLDDNRVYGVATIDFLLDGGDNLHIGRGAVSLQILDKNVIDVMMPYVKSLTAEGKDIVYQKDGRVEILK